MHREVRGDVAHLLLGWLVDAEPDEPVAPDGAVGRLGYRHRAFVLASPTAVMSAADDHGAESRRVGFRPGQRTSTSLSRSAAIVSLSSSTSSVSTSASYSSLESTTPAGRPLRVITTCSCRSLTSSSSSLNVERASVNGTILATRLVYRILHTPAIGAGGRGSVPVGGAADRQPGLPGDAEDDGGDDDCDDRIGDGRAQGDQRGAQHHSQAHEPVRPGVVAVGDEGRALEPLAGGQPDVRGDLV